MAVKVLERFKYTFSDLSGGQNDKVDSLKLRRNEFQKLVDFIYDVGRLDQLKTAEQKKLFVSMLSHKLQEKL